MAYVFLIIALTLNAAANLLLKIGASRLAARGSESLLAAALTDGYLLGGLALFAVNVAFYVLALGRLNLSFAYPVMVTGGVLLVACASALLLREPLTPRDGLGILLLLGGLALLAQRAAA